MALLCVCVRGVVVHCTKITKWWWQWMKEHWVGWQGNEYWVSGCSPSLDNTSLFLSVAWHCVCCYCIVPYCLFIYLYCLLLLAGWQADSLSCLPCLSNLVLCVCLSYSLALYCVVCVQPMIVSYVADLVTHLPQDGTDKQPASDGIDGIAVVVVLLLFWFDVFFMVCSLSLPICGKRMNRQTKEKRNRFVSEFSLTFPVFACGWLNETIKQKKRINDVSYWNFVSSDYKYKQNKFNTICCVFINNP